MLINNLQTKVERNRSMILAAIERVIDSGYFVLGSEVSEFEKSFAAYIGAQHCVGVGNGTDAIEISLRALGVTNGEKVATVANAGMYATCAINTIGGETNIHGCVA